MDKVLVVDDSDTWRTLLEKVLIEYGFTVETAADGIDGLNKFFDFLPDVVITDYVMPRMNGVHLCRLIRSYTSFKNVGILILTGADEAINDFWAKKSGANKFLKKSGDVESITKEILNFLKGNYISGWSKEVYKTRTEPFGELVDVIEETLKTEVINKELLSLVQYVDDEEYMMRKLKSLILDFVRADGLCILLISSSIGRVYSFGFYSDTTPHEYVKSNLLRAMEKPVTPSEWLLKFDSDASEDGFDTNNVKNFVISFGDQELGVMSFKRPRNAESLYYFMDSIGETLGIIAKTVNNFCDQRIATEIDFLTSLFNRKATLSRLKEYIELAKRRMLSLTVAMLDVDDFKEINDTYGHLFGDTVLKEIGKIFRNSMRKSDIVGRYGGEEFLIIFPGIKGAEAVEALERVLDELRNYDWRAVTGKPIKVTVSAGVAEFSDDTTLRELVNKADNELYKAKRSGKDRISVYREN
ncbi:MAG: two-component system, cell cycle response regulator [Kosmotoga sp.]|nr:two-component system, cell cycle response regulator [Kosmotoga sp.]